MGTLALGITGTGNAVYLAGSWGFLTWNENHGKAKNSLHKFWSQLPSSPEQTVRIFISLLTKNTALFENESLNF